LRPSARAIDWPSDVLPTPGGPTKQRIGPERSFFSFVLEDPLLDLLEVVVVFVEHGARVDQVEVVLRDLVPRQRHEPVEIRPDDAVLGSRRRDLLEPRQLAVDRLLHVLRQLHLREARAELVQLRLVGVTLPELVLDRLQLLTQEELALPLLHLLLDLRLDLRAQLEDLELAIQDGRDLAQPRLDVTLLEQRLLLDGLQAQRRGDEVAQRARIFDVGSRDLQLLGQVRHQPDDAAEERLHIARQRFDLARLLELVRQLDELADEVRVVLQRAVEADAPNTLDEDAQRAVGNLDHLVDHGGGSDGVQVVPAGLFRFFVLHRHEGDVAIARDDVLDELDRAFLADRERRGEAREDDRVLEREHRQRGRKRQLVRGLLDVGGQLCHQEALTTIVTLSLGAGRGAIGRRTVRMPRSYVATASSGSMFSASVIWRWNGPWSISICW
jgi:hypothetical protein